MVCQRLFSITCHNKASHFSRAASCDVAFSLTLSKITIVSLILYHIVVKIAMINTVSICIVGSKAIIKPYAHEGILISNNIVTITTKANAPGLIVFLIPEKEKIIYKAIKINPTIKASRADFFIYAPILGPISERETISDSPPIRDFSTKAVLSASVNSNAAASSTTAVLKSRAESPSAKFTHKSYDS